MCVLVEGENVPIMETTGGGQLSESIKEDMTMALSDLASWAQDKAASACGTACGAADKPEEKPAACGSACGAAGKPEEKPAEKPAACGSACGAGDK